MPCTITGSFEGDRALFAEEDLEKAQKKNLKLTQFLCETCQILENMGYKGFVNPKLEKWWKKHKNQDGKRGKK